jgi:hypothetical protein
MRLLLVLREIADRDVNARPPSAGVAELPFNIELPDPRMSPPGKLPLEEEEEEEEEGGAFSPRN